MVPHSQCSRMRKLANILGNYCMRRRREWDNMAAVVGHLGHSVSTDVVVGCCDVCFALGKLASKHTPSDHVGWLPSRSLSSLHTESFTSSRRPIRDIMAA